MKVKAGPFFSVLFLAVVLAGCGAGSPDAIAVRPMDSAAGSDIAGISGGAVTALSVAGRVSVVDAKPDSKAFPPGIGRQPTGPDFCTANPNSDYCMDVTQVWAYERSDETFNLVNEILCLLAWSRYEEMLNAGPYKAMVDMDRCRQEGAEGEEQDRSSGATLPDYALMTIVSERAGYNSPHIVRAWIREKSEWAVWSDVAISAKLTVTEGRGVENPYGSFTMDFAAYPAAGGAVSPDAAVRGSLKVERDSTGRVLLRSAAEGGFGEKAFADRATLRRAADGLTGDGTVHGRRNNSEKRFSFAFNEDFFLRKDTLSAADRAVCLNRNDFEETAWRYGLYNGATGARINRNSGFPVSYTASTGAEYHGWVGYRGLWLPEEVEIKDGATVYADGGTSSYTYHVAGGRLRKHARKAIALADIKNISLDYREPDGRSATGLIYRAMWNGTAFVKDAYKNERTSWVWVETAPSEIDLAHMLWPALNFRSLSLGGNVNVLLDRPDVQADDCIWQVPSYTFDCSANARDSTPVFIYSESTVYPGEAAPFSLSCLEDCPNPTSLNDGEPGNDRFDTWDLNTQIGVAPLNADTVDYALGEDMILRCTSADFGCSGEPVVKTSADGSDIWAGPLFDKSDRTVQAALGCPDWNLDGTPDGTCGWLAWSGLPVYYTWESGANDRNKLAWLTDPANGNAPVRFEPPVRINYSHDATATAAAHDDKYDGVTFYLEYTGLGTLHGIPGSCVDMDTGEPARCGPDTRWVPELIIPAGARAADGADAGVQYIIKPLEIEQRMTESADGCDGLTATADRLPTMDGWQDPAIGPEPTVDGAPAVIGGMLTGP